MEAMTQSGITIGVRPRVAAQDFGVHLRTVFRWIKYGWLESKNGCITTDYKATLLPDWQRSCLFKEARKRLKVSSGTMTAWKNKNLFETVIVMGFERILISSIEKIEQRRRKGTFSLHPTHSLPSLILEITGVGQSTLKAALDSGAAPSDKIDGIRMIPNEEVAKIKKDWTSSCRSIGAQRILSKSKDSIRRWKSNGRLPMITVLGEQRVALSGLAKTPEEKQRLKDYLCLEKKKYLRRVNNGIKMYRKKKRAENAKKRTKLKERQSRERFRAKRLDLPYKPPPRPKTVPVPDYTPSQVRVKGFESRRLTTCEEAAKATAKTSGKIKELFESGKIRGVVVDEQIFIYMVSVEALVTKLRQGIKYTAD